MSYVHVLPPPKLILEKETATSPPKISYFTATHSNPPTQRGLWSPGGLCVATFTSHKLKEEMEAKKVKNDQSSGSQDS